MNLANLPIDEAPSRYIVGIDLGTTNSAVCYVDTESTDRIVNSFPVVQLTAPGQVEARDTLPSFHFQPTRVDGHEKALALPWQAKAADHVVGMMARDEGALAPGRLIASAKSWLCHAGVDRTAEILPWHGADDVDRLSPIEVSARYLRQIKESWDHRWPDYPLAEQDIVLTLPASFDEVARELTVKAAAQADLPRVVLIEEPQAAFYAWVNRHQDHWESLVQAGQKILVCDIGGGTSDFTLIRVRRAEDQDEQQNQDVVFHRIAVGDHLILGGDNLDLALATHLETKLSQDVKLQPRQWDVLVRSCRQAKETLLGSDPPEQMTINLPGAGSRLIGGSLRVEVTRSEVEQVLIDGFFPRIELNDEPEQRRSGFQEFGLPYTPDSAITRYLSAFLRAHRHADIHDPDDFPYDPARPDLILLNGGLFASPLIQQRLLDTVTAWFGDQDGWAPTLLENDRLDMAVARGAAYYGMVRRGEGVRIAAGLARSYYVGASHHQDEAAVCVVPGSAQPGDAIELPEMEFDLRISEPVEFPLHVSSTRLTDMPGNIVEINPEQMRTLPPLRTALRTQRRNQRGTVPVRLHAQLSEIGTIELSLQQTEGDRRWRLQFDVRAATQTDHTAGQSFGEHEGVLDETLWAPCEELLTKTFADDATRKPSDLVKSLVQVSGMDRNEWPMSLLRRIWEKLVELESGRRKSQQHEARWLNLLGFSLRPGYGMPVDDWRVTESWRLVQGKLAHKSAVCRTESWILWRRIAGGLPAGQQRALAEPLLASVKALHRRMTAAGVKGEAHFTIPEFAELWRLLASLELLSPNVKLKLGQMLTDLLGKRKLESVRPAIAWALGRLGSRVPIYGPLNTVISAESISPWIDALIAAADDDPTYSFTVMQLSRRTGDRYRDIGDSTRETVVDWLKAHDCPQHILELVTTGGDLDSAEQQRAFGESLPRGLQIR
ncbi:MAG: molecular chaperone DnaK [Planctomycetaceae bacterium]|nr:molecular chaperone DnaK [Planctomycetaceae bacterium]